MHDDRFRSAFEQAPVGICLISVAEDYGDRFIQVNGRLASLLGHTPADLEGHPVGDFTHRDDRHIDLQRLSAPDESARIEKRFLHATGHPVWTSVHYSLARDDAGIPLHFVAQIEDIAANKESERALLAALEQQNDATRNLRKIDQVRTEMVATISHELRTPLTSILGNTEMLIDGDAGPLNPEQARLLNTIDRSTRRLTDLANDLLTLAEMDANGPDDSQSSYETIDLGALTQTVLDSLAPMLAAKDQILTTDLPAASAYVRGDASQLDRTLVNVVSNASKFTPAGGHINVTMHAGDGELHVVVTDDGIGIPKLEQDKLFERFYRTTAAYDLAIKGTGLGLAIVKSILEQHGGRIKVYSAPGSGSTFTITLPKAVVVPASHR